MPLAPARLSHCAFAYECRTCARKVECHRFDGLVRARHLWECENCPDRIERLKISAVLTAFNEGEEVRKTVESLAASIEDASLEIILVDDGSKDRSCQGLADLAYSAEAVASAAKAEPQVKRHCLKVIRHEKALGVGVSRNAGAAAATGHVVTFHDAHMRFPTGALEALALKALTSEAIVYAASAGMDKARAHLFGCDLFWNSRYGLQPKWRQKAEPEEWTRVPCMMGAGYVISASTIQHLMGPTGALWEDTAGRWGFSEQALAVKAFLLDVPVLTSRTIFLRHLYRSANPVPESHHEMWRNICRATRVLLPPAPRASQRSAASQSSMWEERFGFWCKKSLAETEFREIVAEADTHRPDPSTWKRDPETIFTHLCGRDSLVTDRHPNHQWLPELERALAMLASAHPGGRNLRLLQWRPGEATVLARRLLPEAEIRVIEAPGERFATWRALCKSLRIDLHQCELGPDYIAAPPALRRPAGYDLILVGGGLQAGCKEAASALLRPGGPASPSNSSSPCVSSLPCVGGSAEQGAGFAEQGAGFAGREGGAVLVDESQGRAQIAHEDAKKEEEALKSYSSARVVPPAPVSPSEAGSSAREGGNAQAGKTAAVSVAGSPTPASPSSAATSFPGPSTPPRTGPRAATGGLGAGEPPLITVLILNYKRPQNIGPMLDCLAGQTVRLQVFLWNNGDPLLFAENRSDEGAPGPANRPMREHPLVKLYVESSPNMRCWPRWLMASMADTEYVCSMDDDLVFADAKVLEDAIAASRDKCPDGVVGFFGWEAIPGRDYKGSRHVNGSATDRWVDFIKGRFMLFRRDLLERVPLAHPVFRDPNALKRRGDDLYVNLCISRGRRNAHLVPGILGKRWKELPQQGHAVSGESGHYRERGELLDRLFESFDAAAELAGAEQP